jgi:hypothetical protein
LTATFTSAKTAEPSFLGKTESKHVCDFIAKVDLNLPVFANTIKCIQLFLVKEAK